MLHLVTTILIPYSSFIHLTVLPALVPDKPPAARSPKENSSHTHTQAHQVSKEETREEASDMAECSWSAQAGLELLNS